MAEPVETPEGALHALAGPLRVLSAVAEHGHVTRAAEALRLPQPTVSRALARLQSAVGVPLLTRTGRGIALTPAGRTLAAAARRGLDEVAAGLALVADTASPTSGRVGLAFLHTMGAEAVPALVSAFRTEHTGLRFSLVQGSADAVLARLEAGDVDLVLTSPLPQRPRLVAHALAEQPLVLVLPAGHRLARRTAVRLVEVRDEPFVGFEEGYGMRGITERLCAAAGFAPRLAFEGQDAGTVRGLVAAGLGVAVLPRVPGSPPAGVVERELRGPAAARTVGLVWRDAPLPGPARLFRDFVLAREDPLGVGR
ncbi:LysR family transcriptional regulator [Kineococcus glutinatus]|uniref:LysR family transcriptional regulator n=1 Tax=Kineococcus glutinatus TaxID=1070872 RepID=A0ABP9HTN7_9ACTN